MKHVHNPEYAEPFSKIQHAQTTSIYICRYVRKFSVQVCSIQAEPFPPGDKSLNELLAMNVTRANKDP